MTLPALISCREQLDPFEELAAAWASPKLYQSDVQISRNGEPIAELGISAIIPGNVALPAPIPLYWDQSDTFLATFSPLRPINPTPEQLVLMREITAILLQAPSSRKRPADRDFVILFIPTVPHEHLETWMSEFQGTVPLLDAFERNETPIGIIRVVASHSEPRLFCKWIVPDNPKDALQVELKPLPRRRNFLQPRPAQAEPDSPGAKKIIAVPVDSCTLDKLPAQNAMVGLLISAILDRMAATMVADALRKTVLRDVGMQDLSHVLTAITTPLAQASTDYQLYEFYGDAVLKFTASCQLFFRQPDWREGLLSENRDKIINNKYLAQAALDHGLDRFILNNRFTPRKWDAPYTSKKLEQAPEKQRILSLKVLADVVEAIIGAAYLEGGVQKAQACLHCLVPGIDIEFESRLNRGRIHNHVDTDRIATLIGYTFQDASLITEALTHPSCEHDQVTQSYQRLEYLGDAVLDMLVVSELAKQSHRGTQTSSFHEKLNHRDLGKGILAQGKMTMIKHSLVNANLLAFFCMELATPDATSPEGFRFLWDDMYVIGPCVSLVRDTCLPRHVSLRLEILKALNTSPQYPWELLARLHADKFLSDIVESVLGAIFLDAGLEACHTFLDNIGILPYFRRILSENVNVQHPRNAAQDLYKHEGTLSFKSRRIETRGKQATYQCSVMLNKNVLAFAEGSRSAEEAEIRVAHMLIKGSQPAGKKRKTSHSPEISEQE